VVAATLQALTCSNCGAQLTAAPEGNIVRCAYCRAEHVFAAQPLSTDRGRGGHVAGEAVRVEWGGKWWKAHVIEVISEVSWKIHYDGWSDRWDEVVSSDRIAAAGPTSTSAVQEPRRSRWGLWLAIGFAIVAVVVGVGIWAGTGGDDAVAANGPPPGAPFPPHATLTEGEPVWGYSMGQWWRAEIIRPLPNGRYEVRYIGYDKSWNESLAMDQLRRRVE
jgi:hypothetical protein